MIIDLLAIVGQTASGKSDLALKVAQTVGNTEIIAADSRTVYQGLDIGTAKPSLADQKKVKHHLLDIVTPHQSFNVKQFQTLANQTIQDVQKRGKLPILVGGSGLYIDSVLFNYSFAHRSPVQPQLRNQLSQLTIEQLWAKIKDLNLKMPENKLNKRYLIRTIEKGPQNEAMPSKWRKNTLAVGLKFSSEILKQRINQRLKLMLKEGLLDEVEKAFQLYPAESEALKSNIYVAFKPYLAKKISFQVACDDFIKRDLALAKKQLTWFKRNQQIKWFADSRLALKYILNQLADDD